MKTKDTFSACQIFLFQTTKWQRSAWLWVQSWRSGLHIYCFAKGGGWTGLTWGSSRGTDCGVDNHVCTFLQSIRGSNTEIGSCRRYPIRGFIDTIEALEIRDELTIGARKLKREGTRVAVLRLYCGQKGNIKWLFTYEWQIYMVLGDGTLPPPTPPVLPTYNSSLA